MQEFPHNTSRFIQSTPRNTVELVSRDFSEDEAHKLTLQRLEVPVSLFPFLFLFSNVPSPC